MYWSSSCSCMHASAGFSVSSGKRSILSPPKPVFWRLLRLRAVKTQAEGGEKKVEMAELGGPSTSSAIDFFNLIYKLKATKRTGWVRRGVKGPESIADHMYRMSMMALISPHSGVDTVHAMKVALVHDLAEAIVGDITPDDPMTKEEKFQRERDAMSSIRAMLGEDTAIAKEIEALWHEYEEQKTPESHFVKDLDKLEMIIQAREYEEEQGIDLSEFFDSTRGKFTTPLGKAWADEVERRRDAARQPK